MPKFTFGRKLVAKLSNVEREELEDMFNRVDATKDGELKQQQAAGRETSEPWAQQGIQVIAWSEIDQLHAHLCLATPVTCTRVVLPAGWINAEKLAAAITYAVGTAPR
jgi:hypothetical protein